MLHYAVECFEGMKAYKDAQGRIRLFRPDCNMQRLNKSMERLYLPQVCPQVCGPVEGAPRAGDIKWGAGAKCEGLSVPNFLVWFASRIGKAP